MNRTFSGLISAFLCLAVLLSLVSCGSNSAGETVPISDTPTANDAEAQTVNGKTELSFKSRSESIKAQNGTVVYTGSVTFPEVKIKASPEAEKAINGLIESEVQKVLSPEYDYIAEYNSFIAEGADYYSPASFTVNMDLSLGNEKYLSFKTCTYVHNACAASDSEGCSGVTFDITTGRLLSAADIFTDTDAFHSKVIATVQRQISEKTKSKELMSAKPDTAAALIAEDDFGWCLGRDELLVFFPSGAIAPALFGAQEFTVPLSELIN